MKSVAKQRKITQRKLKPVAINKVTAINICTFEISISGVIVFEHSQITHGYFAINHTFRFISFLVDDR